MKVIYDDMELNPAALLLGLYRNTRAVGMGVLQDKPDFSLEDAETVIAERDERGWGFTFDYVYGRPIKISVEDTDVIHQRSIHLYERDAGEGAFMRAVEFAIEHTD